MKNKRIFPAFCFFFLFTAALYTQNSPESDNISAPQPEQELLSAEEPPKIIELSPEQQRIEMEVKTSTLGELAQWSRRLGLSESGTRDDLSLRIRQYYNLPETEVQADTGRKTITVESAQRSEYFRIEVTDEEYARLSGDVRLTLTDNNTVHKISAGEILFNRTRNTITASGKVIYQKETGNTIETFRGESITVNIDDWSSIFLDGNSERKIAGDETAYLFSGTVISRTNEDATILNNATITNANNPEALWSISASKLWLLPGSDFAFVNAILKVGEIPIFYFPAFYYPADDMIFHPVLGYRNREGGFIQTTTYIIGRPKPETTELSSITKILGNTGATEKEQQGLFLRSTGKKSENPDSISLKALFDYYVNLGAFFGIDFYIPKNGIFNSLDFSIGFGLTRTLTLTEIGYTPYAPKYDGTSDWNDSNFFSLSVPFRYRMLLQSSITAEYGSLSWNLPFYSDPYVNRDFTDRSEKMDFLNFMTEKPASNLNTDAENELEIYHWYIGGNINLPVKNLNPYISRLSVSDLSTSLSFRTIRDDNIFFNNREAPERYFYAPYLYTIYNFSISVWGNPLTIGGENARSPSGTKTENEDLFNGIGNPISPWKKEDSISGSNQQEKLSDDKLLPPVLSQYFEIPTTGNIKFDIDYQLSPAGASELQFMTGKWDSYDKVDWSEVQTVLASFSGTSFVNFHANHTKELFSNVFTFSGSGTWRDYSYLNKDADIFLTMGVTDQSKIDNFRRQQYSKTNYSTSYEYKGTLRPLYQDDIFSESSLQYTFRGTLLRSRRYSGGNGPELTPQWGSWVKEENTANEQILGLNKHQFSVNIAADIIEKQQILSVSVDMPPLDMLIATNAIFRLWISETRINFRIRKQPEVLNIRPERWVYDPVNFTEILKFGNDISFTYYMVLTPEENNEITTITSALSLWNFGASFKAQKMLKYRFDPVNPLNPPGGGSWVRYGDPSLNPSELAFYYKRDFQKMDIIKNRISFSFDIDSSLVFNLQQYTNSNFQFQLGFRLGIAGFLELRLSATSENNVIWRYFKGMPGMADLTSMYIDGPQNNVFVDLFDSFNFFDDAKRQRSGFKMKRFDLSFIHYLGDWRAELGIKVYPYLNTIQTPSRYFITSDISFTVQWKPISEIKTNMEYKGETGRWTRN